MFVTVSMSVQTLIDGLHFSILCGCIGSFRMVSVTQVRRMRVPLLLRFLRHVQLSKILTQTAKAGSIYALLILVFGGFYEKPWQMPGVVARIGYTVALTLCEYVARGCKPLFPEWTLPFELARAMTRTLMSSYGDRIAIAKCAQHVRRQTEVAGSTIGFFVARQREMIMESFYHNGLEHLWIRSKKQSLKTNKPVRRIVLLYLHGGGFAVLSPRLYIHFACDLHHRLHNHLSDHLGHDEEIDVAILLANYRKIPEHSYPVPALDVITMYKYLLEDMKLSPSDIILGGDSAGGGLAITAMLRLRDESPALLPVAAIVSCPFADLESRGDERKVPYCIIGDKAGIAICSLYYPQEGDPSTWGDASPVHCDLRGLPPVYIVGAELDYILPHAQRLYDKAQADGVTDWKLEIFHNVPHDFTFFPSSVMPSAALGLEAMAKFAATRVAEAVSGRKLKLHTIE